MERQVQGTTAIVTGGGRGVGAAMARALAEAGASVGLIARSGDEIATVAAELRRAGADAHPVAADVTDLAAIRKAVASIEEALGPTDLLICNAGVSGGRPRPTWTFDPADWWRVQEVNVLGAMHLVHAVVPGMVERGRGRVIHVGSLIGARAEPGSSAYGVSKAALMRFAEVLAADLEGTGVVSLSISPGLVLTRMTQPMADHFDIPLEEWNDAARAGELVVRLAAGDGDALSGCLIHVADDLDAMVERADEIRERGWYALRFVRGLESLEPA